MDRDIQTINREHRLKIGSRIKSLRRAKLLNQQEFADLAGISVKTLYNVETGAYAGVMPRSLDAICKTLGVSIDDVTGNENSDPGNSRPADTDAEKLMRTLSLMPVDVRVAMYVLGGWLSRLPEERRSAEIDRLILLTVDDQKAE